MQKEKKEHKKRVCVSNVEPYFHFLSWIDTQASREIKHVPLPI